jgi:hypothetical protein
MAVQRRVLGEEHPDTTEVKVDLAEAKVLRQHYSEAETLLREALKTLEKTSPDARARYTCQSVLGSLAGQGSHVCPRDSFPSPGRRPHREILRGLRKAS